MGTIRRIGALATIALCWTLTALANAETLGKVGRFGDPRHLVVRGATAFRPETVRDGLVSNLDVLLASRPDAPLHGYLSVLEEKAAEGFRHAGFADPKVHAAAEPKSGQVVLTVDEGRRLVSGEIRVEGAAAIPVGELIRQLQSPHPPEGARPDVFDRGDGKQQVRWLANKAGSPASSQPATMEDPAWQPGKPVALSAQGKSQLHDEIEPALANLGYYHTVFSMKIAAQPDQKTAALVIQIRKEGAKATVGEIVILGNHKNSRNEILKYLGLKVGGPGHGR